MIVLSTIDHIYLYPGVTDLRKGRNSLRHTEYEISKDDNQHKLSLFCNRNTNLIKIGDPDFSYQIGTLSL